MSIAVVNGFVFSGGAPAPPANVTYAVQDFATGSATGDLDVTSGTMSGITPKGAIVLSTAATVAAGSSETAEGAMSIGFVDANEYLASSFKSQDNVATTNCVTRGNERAVNLMVASSTTVEAATASMISGGVRLNFSTNDATDRRAVTLQFGGSNVSAEVTQVQLGTGTSAIDVTDPGFEPNIVFAQCPNISGATFGAASAPNRVGCSFGIATWDGSTVVQRSVFYYENDGQADGAPFAALSTAYIGGFLNGASGLSYNLTIGSFDSSGFSITPSASAASARLGTLAVKTTGARAKLVDITTPTSTGSWAITGAGFTPRLAVVVLTNLEAVDTYAGATSDNQCGFSISFIGDEHWSSSIRADSGAATTDTASNCQNQALLGPSATNTAAISGTLTSFDSDGMTLNLSATQATGKKGFVLFVE